MTDSENDKTLPAITRRKMLFATTAYLSALTDHTGASHPSSDQESNAPGNVLALWRAWYDAHEEDRPIVVRTCAQIDTLLPGDAMAEARKTAKTELAARLQKWNAADELFGYSRTRHAETQMAGVEEASAKLLWEAPAHTTSDIIAKLHAIIETEDPGSHFKERPWPQLRMVLTDLVRIERLA
jgi:hypothetical protein